MRRRRQSKCLLKGPLSSTEQWLEQSPPGSPFWFLSWLAFRSIVHCLGILVVVEGLGIDPLCRGYLIRPISTIKRDHRCGAIAPRLTRATATFFCTLEGSILVDYQKKDKRTLMRRTHRQKSTQQTKRPSKKYTAAFSPHTNTLRDENIQRSTR